MGGDKAAYRLIWPRNARIAFIRRLKICKFPWHGFENPCSQTSSNAAPFFDCLKLRKFPPNFPQIFPATIFHFSSLTSHTRNSREFQRINARVNKLKQAGKMLASGIVHRWKEISRKERGFDWLIWKETLIFTSIFVSIMVFVTYTDFQIYNL